MTHGHARFQVLIRFDVLDADTLQSINDVQVNSFLGSGLQPLHERHGCPADGIGALEQTQKPEIDRAQTVQPAFRVLVNEPVFLERF